MQCQLLQSMDAASDEHSYTYNFSSRISIGSVFECVDHSEILCHSGCFQALQILCNINYLIQYSRLTITTTAIDVVTFNLVFSRHTKRGGGEEGGYFPGAPKLLRGPKTFKGPHEAYFYDFYHCFSYLSLSQHCLDSMSERLGRIIGNAFMVSVDKLFDTCKYVEPTPLNNLTTLHEQLKFFLHTLCT